MHLNHRFLPVPLAALALGCASLLPAADLGSIAIHGAVSATAAVSERYNYLGETKGSPALNVVEAIINGSHRFDGGLAASAQLYAYEVDNYSDLALDFAALSYSFGPSLGLRAGRIKRPAGLYGEVQDIDFVRPFAFLPLDFYQKTLRPITASYDGAALFGTLPLGAAGSLDYQAGYGYLPRIASETAYLRNASQNTPNHVDRFDGDTVSSIWVAWNLPLDGLRGVYSRNDSRNFTLSGEMKTAAQLALAPGSARLIPLAFPAGAWDFMVAGQPAAINGHSLRETFSVEYVRGDWEWAVEYQLTTNDVTMQFPAPLGANRSQTRQESYYAMASWQAGSRWQLGAYYGEAYNDRNDRRGRQVVVAPSHTAWLKDGCVAASYSATDWWLVKAEVHVLNGTLGVPSYNNRDVTTWKPDWTYFVLKNTISF